MLLCTVTNAVSASWRWSVASSGRERLQITLDAPDAGLTVTRTDTRILSVHLTEPGSFSEQPAPEQAKLFTGARQQGTTIALMLSSPAFGYIVLRPSPVQVIIDVYPDPLGLRWKAPDAPAMPPAAATADGSRETLVPHAHAAPLNADASAGEQTPRIQGQGIRAGINKAGPDAWPEDRALSSGPAVQRTLPRTAPVNADERTPPPPAAFGPVMSAPITPPAPPAAPPSTDSPPAASRPVMSAPVMPPAPPAAPPSTAPPPTASRPAPGKVLSLPPLPEELQKPSPPRLPPLPPAVQSGQREEASQPAAAPPQAAALQESPQTRQPSGSQPSPSPPQARGTQVMGQAEVPHPASANATKTNATVPVVYVDDKGNPVPKPLDPEELMAQATASMGQKEYRAALETLNTLKGMPLPAERKEQALYMYSDAVWELYKDTPLEGFEHIIAATNEAMNANMRSPGVPGALLRLGEANLLVGNLREAEAYFGARRTAYPPSPDVPRSFLKLGQAHLKNKNYAKSAAIFRDILQKYPESPDLRMAAVSLASALAALKETKEAGIVLDFVERRWPRHYLEDPAFLLLEAEYSLRHGKLQDALQQYWLYYNLEPDKPGNDDVLRQIGETYLRQGRLQPAMDVFAEIPRRYPDSAGADYALLRLAERGIHDGPAITKAEMFSVFDNPGVPAPQTAYATLKNKNTPIGVLAALKLVLWQLWSKQYVDAIAMAAEYIDLHPEEPGASLARQVILEAFDQEAKQALQEENYGRILLLWNGFPLIRAKHSPLEDTMRTALAKAHLERGEDAAAVELLGYFLQGEKNPRYGEYAFTFFFNRYLGAGDWNGVLDLGERVAGWAFPPLMRNELDYAMALSAENLGLPRKALPLWQKLSLKDDIPLYEKAYATYFLAKDAERRKDIKDAYNYNKAALELFTRLDDERSDKADPERAKELVSSLMDICEVANRIPEALEWVERYSVYAPEASPEYAGVRFRESRLYRKMGDIARSRALLEQIVRAEPDSPFGKAAASELRTFDVSRDLDRFAPGQ